MCRFGADDASEIWLLMVPPEGKCECTIADLHHSSRSSFCYLQCKVHYQQARVTQMIFPDQHETHLAQCDDHSKTGVYLKSPENTIQILSHPLHGQDRSGQAENHRT